MGEQIATIWGIIKTYKAKLGMVIMVLTTVTSIAYGYGVTRGTGGEKLDSIDGRVTNIEKWVELHSASDKSTAVDAAKSITELQTKMIEVLRRQDEQSRKLDEIRDRLPPKP